MHDRTRRLLCRWGFLLLGVGPTLAVVIGIGVVRSPSYIAAQRAACERQLSEILGLNVAVAEFRQLLQGVTQLEQVTLTEPETGEAIGRIRHLEFGRQAGQWVILASQPEIEGAHVWRLWEALHERLLRTRGADAADALFYAGELTVRPAGGQRATTLTDVRASLRMTDGGPQTALEFRDVALQMSEPAQLRITRDRQVQPPATRWELNTRSTALPCSLLADYLDILRTAGDRATFQGTIAAAPSAKGWAGEITGRFLDVDLDRLTERRPHKLSGFAEVVLHRARFQDGRVVDAAGDIACHGGVVTRSLLYQADKSLGLVADARLLAPQANTLVAFRELRLGFTLDQAGIRIAGQCPPLGSGVVMTDEGGPLLSSQGQDVIQVTALVRTLSPDSGGHVPANYEAYQLLHVLPIPTEHEGSQPSLARPLYPRLRLQ